MASGKRLDRHRWRGAPSAGYLNLIGRFSLRLLTSEHVPDRATAVRNLPLDRGDLDPSERDYLDVLSDRIKRYDAKYHSIPTQDLAQCVGDRS